MVKVRLIGPKAAQWNVGGRFLQGEGVYDLTDVDVTAHQDVIDFVVKNEKELIDEPSEKEVIKPVSKKKIYTKEELLEISKSGIGSLREIGNIFGVKFRSVSEGIREILEAQG